MRFTSLAKISRYRHSVRLFGKFTEKRKRKTKELDYLDNNSAINCFAEFFLWSLFFIVRKITGVRLFV